MNDMEAQGADALSPPTPVCAIGASAGGVEALTAFFKATRSDIGLAYVVIMHLEPTTPSQMVAILTRVTDMPVAEVSGLMHLEADHVYVIAPDQQLVIDDHSVATQNFTEPRGKRAPIDLFFRSLAEKRADGIAVILSGAGSDGAVGVRAVKEAGGVVCVQDPDEAQFGVMPRSAIATGAADVIAPIGELVSRIAEISRSKAALHQLDRSELDEALHQIIRHLRSRTGHDFSNYKKATLLRRITRRMQVARRVSLDAYLDYLQKAPEEANALFSDLLITVTAFFRDQDSFQTLASKGLPRLFEGLEDDSDLRIWVAGCATGEEAYSLAILIQEEMDQRRPYPRVQIFATDLDEGALSTGREGLYPDSIRADVSDERLERFFQKEDTHFRIRNDLRDMVLFAPHSLLKEPPFIRLDLISCRNLLIYLERDLQTEVAALFHYGLNPGGLLFLGSAETLDDGQDLFTPVDREHRLYQVRGNITRGLPRLPQPPGIPQGIERRYREGSRHRDEQSIAAQHLAALEDAAPPSILVDAHQHVLHLSDTAGHYLLPSRGPLASDIVQLVRPELRLDLKSALTRAVDLGQPTLTLPINVAFNGARRRTMIQVAPRRADRNSEPHQALILFLDGGPVDEAAAVPLPDDPDGGSEEVRQLRRELHLAHERLATSRREHDGAIEELRSANEELQSINEEYRSTSEELETSKEELQSMNEELQTVNAELKNKLESISSAHSDLQNLISSTELGTLFLDSGLQIRLFTPRIAELFNVTESDIGRPITDFTHNLGYDGIREDSRRVMDDLMPLEREISSRDDRWLLMRIRPYRTIANRIEGVVVSFIDVTGRREAEERLRRSEARLKSILAASRVVALEWDRDHDRLVSEGPLDLLLRAQDRPLLSLSDLIDSALPEDRDALTADLMAALDKDEAYHLVFRAPDGAGPRWLRLDGAPTRFGGRVTGLRATVSDMGTIGLPHSHTSPMLRTWQERTLHCASSTRCFRTKRPLGRGSSGRAGRTVRRAITAAW